MPHLIISVIIPCYNQAQFLSRALESILGQSYTSWECIIVNDGSSDQTAEIAKKYTDIDTRFIFISQSNRGVSAARNCALQIAKGSYIKFLDADDWISNNSLKDSLTQIENKNTIVFCKVKSYIQEKDEYLNYHYDILINDLNFDNILLNFGDDFDIPIHSALISRNLLETFTFNETLALGEDWLMWLHIFKQKPLVCILDKQLAYYRKWKGSVTNDEMKTLINVFNAYQCAIEIYDLNSSLSRALNERIFNRIIGKINKLENDNLFIQNSVSFKISFFFVKKIKCFFQFFKKQIAA